MPRLAKVNVVYRLASVVFVGQIGKGVRVFKVANVAEIVDLGHSSI